MTKTICKCNILTQQFLTHCYLGQSEDRGCSVGLQKNLWFALLVIENEKRDEQRDTASASVT